jgi:amidase
VGVGGVVAGKAACEDLCCSGSSFATARGPVRNPHNEEHCAGGSSSGCAALVRTPGPVLRSSGAGLRVRGTVHVPVPWVQGW